MISDLVFFLFPSLLLIILTFFLRNLSVHTIVSLYLIIQTFKFPLWLNAWVYQGARMCVCVFCCFSTVHTEHSLPVSNSCDPAGVAMDLKTGLTCESQPALNHSSSWRQTLSTRAQSSRQCHTRSDLSNPISLQASTSGRADKGDITAVHSPVCVCVGELRSSHLCTVWGQTPTVC